MSIDNEAIFTPHYTEKDLAERWNVSVKAIQKWRQDGEGPEYIKLNKAVRYPFQGILKYERDHLKQSTAA